MADITRREVLVGAATLGLAALAGPGQAAARQVPASPLLSVQHGAVAVVVVRDFGGPDGAAEPLPTRQGHQHGVRVASVAAAEDSVIAAAKWVRVPHREHLGQFVGHEAEMIRSRSLWMPGNCLLAHPALLSGLRPRAASDGLPALAGNDAGPDAGRWAFTGWLSGGVAVYTGEHLGRDEMVLLYRDACYDRPGTILADDRGLTLIVPPATAVPLPGALAGEAGSDAEGVQDLAVLGGIRSRMTRIRVD